MIDLILTLSLVGLLLFQEWRHYKMIKLILAMKISKNAEEFDALINKQEEQEEEGKPEEIPLDDLSPEDMLRVLNK